IDAGLTVLVLEQKPEDLFRLGLRCEERGFRQVFVREAAALPGIVDGDLADWRGEATLVAGEADPGYWPHRLVMPGTKAQRPARCGTHAVVASVAIEVPQKGAFRPLVECGFDLAYSPLLEWRHGRGRVVFCQLDLTGRVGVDPAATRVARALLAGLSAPVDPATRALQVLGDGGDAKALAALGFAAGDGAGTLVASPLGAAGPAGLRYAVAGAAAAPGWTAVAALDATPALDPLPIGGVTIGPALLRFRLPLAAQTRGGALVASADGVPAIGVAPTAADGGERSRARLTALRLRTLYQRALTGLGARSDEAVVRRLTTLGEPPRLPGSGPALLPLTAIEVAEPERYAGLTGKALLDAPAATTPLRWQSYERLLASRDEAGYGGVVGGTVDLAHAFRCRPGTDQRSSVRARFTLPAAARINLYAGADYWARVSLDGRQVIDLSAQQGAPRRVAATASVDLAAGDHELAAVVVSGSGGFSCSLAVDTAATPRGEADFMPDIARYGRWMRPYNPPGSEALYLAARSDDDDPYLYYLW
ncbi:MAG: hypothetical protein L6R48_25070, partial [Planctomycetes bacterium]|nr:hypothetical protein [Planctomycetota bacterium]